MPCDFIGFASRGRCRRINRGIFCRLRRLASPRGSGVSDIRPVKLACGGGVAGRRHVTNRDYIRKLMAAGIIAKAAIDGDGRRVPYTLTERAGKVLGDLYRQTDDLR